MEGAFGTSSPFIGFIKFMITTRTVTIPYTNDNEVVENELRKRGIDPVRWAVVSVEDNELYVSVSYEIK